MPQSIILNLHIIYVFKSFHLNFLTCMDSVSSCSSLEMMGNCVKFVRIASLLSSWMICSSQYNKNCFFNFSTQNCTENWTDTKYDMSLWYVVILITFALVILFSIENHSGNMKFGTWYFAIMISFENAAHNWCRVQCDEVLLYRAGWLSHTERSRGYDVKLIKLRHEPMFVLNIWILTESLHENVHVHILMSS